MRNALLLFYFLFLFSLINLRCRVAELDKHQYANWYLTIGGVTQYHTSTTVPTGYLNGNYFSCNNDTSIQMFFKYGSPTYGKYHIVSETNAANNTLGLQDIAIEFNLGLDDVYLSIDGTDSASLVSFGSDYAERTEGVLPDPIKLVHFKNGVALDTVTGGGHMYWR